MSDFLIIGGGVIGLSIAREIKRRRPSASVTLIEKEADCGQHASGRNSGVLHAGFYYSANSLKARFCKEGNWAMQDYCNSRNIPINRCGKLVVATKESEIEGLHELYRRGQSNGVPLTLLTAKEAQEIEPRAKTLSHALYSPTTASVNPALVLRAMAEDAKNEGITLHTHTAYLKRTSDGILTTRGPLSAHFVVNAAGLYADRIALDFGFSKNYRILPFKGLYLYSSEPPGTLRTHIYPVPDLKYPFLGVHFTLTDQGAIKIGPTAIPALWREQYKGLSRFSAPEFLEIALRQTRLLFSSPFDFKKLAFHELQKYLGSKMVALAQDLALGVNPSHYRTWGKSGIRAQLLNTKTSTLENDFVIEGDDRSLHILNAVSPAFTASLPFARFAVDGIPASLLS